MSYTLKYNPDQLRSRASELRGYAAAHADAVDRVTNLINRLPDIWSGKAEEKFMVTFQEQAVSFKNFDDVLEQFALALESSAANMESADQAMFQKINSAK